jgi:3',5'-cyclic AMP phosphodiesterase CpdA
MKIIHISDIHIHPEPILGLDPVANFRRCLAHVEDNHPDADRIIITGDLAHRGLAESYAQLREMLSASSLQDERRPRLLIGNHDSREAFLAAFPEAATDANGFVQRTEETGAGTFVYLDTVDAGEHSGRYCAARRQWLDKVLAACRAASRPAWLFMHHNPTAVHVANADRIGIVDEREMKELLSAYRDTIRHMFFGHCHYTLSGSLSGIPFSAPRSTNHTCWPDFSGIAERMGYGELQPNYNVCFLDGDDVVVHSIDFLDEEKVRWLADK